MRLARLFAWLFRRHRPWPPSDWRVSQRWLEQHWYEGIREERMRQGER